MNGEYVADIVSGALDSTGVKIETVYSRLPPTYAVYRTSERVVVQFADDKALGSDQRVLLAPLNVTRGEINGLIDGWRLSSNPDEKAMAKFFDGRVAYALGVALQGQSDQALVHLSAIKSDLLEERMAAARRDYLITATVTMVIVAAFSLMLLMILGDIDSSLMKGSGSEISTAGLFTWPAAIGGIGAFFSIAIGIRGRTILTDLQTNDNRADATLRVVIGALSAIVLTCLLTGKFVTFGFGEADIGSDNFSLTKPSILVVVAFVAGFSERLVGDFLARGTIEPLAPTSNNTVSGGAGGPASRDSNANEQNPLGRPARDKSPDRTVADPAPLTEEDLDGCCSGLQLAADAITEDIDLPPASGGVEAEAA